jgi:poly-gamma-glutamate capsule biosynthesis protein CapA/YwtB (metallophosphatase superfamily)
VRKQLQAPDLMIANLEGTYSSGGPSKCGATSSSLCYAFQAPPSYAKALPWAGIDLVSVANNHSYDYLARGFTQTTQALVGAGVKYAGLPGKVTVVKVEDVRVAVVAFSPYSWNPNVNDIPSAVKLIKRAAGKADVVVVLMHVGAEGADKIHTPKGPEVAFGEQRGNPRAFSHAAVDAGADLVLGSGPHVIRGIERYRGRLIAYSLGNFGGWGNFGLGGNLSLSGLLTVRVDEEGRVQGGRWLSLRLASPGVPKVDSSHTAARLVRRLSAEDFSRTYRLDDQGRFSAK